MTDTERQALNERIALRLGWRQWIKGRGDWIPPGKDSDSIQALPPDFCGEWEHAGPLQVELWEAGFDLCHDGKDGTFYWWGISNEYPEPLDDDREETTDVLIATCLDWLAWKDGEER